MNMHGAYLSPSQVPAWERMPTSALTSYPQQFGGMGQSSDAARLREIALEALGTRSRPAPPVAQSSLASMAVPFAAGVLLGFVGASLVK